MNSKYSLSGSKRRLRKRESSRPDLHNTYAPFHRFGISIFIKFCKFVFCGIMFFDFRKFCPNLLISRQIDDFSLKISRTFAGISRNLYDLPGINAFYKKSPEILRNFDTCMPHGHIYVFHVYLHVYFVRSFVYMYMYFTCSPH